MKIVQLIFSLSSGGAEKFVVNLSNELAAMGNEVCVCMLREETDQNSFNKQFLNETVAFVSLNIPVGFSIRNIPVVERFLDDFKPDVVHCHLNVLPFIYRYALIHREIKFLHTLHSVAKYASGLPVQVLINKFYYKTNIIQPVTISGICNESFQNLYGLQNAGLIVNGVPQVIQTNNFSLVRKEIIQLTGGTNIPIFIHVARFHPLKNQSLLVDAFNEVSSNGVDFRLLIIGRDYDEREGKMLKNKACEKILFLGEKFNVGDYLLCSDAFCLSSEYEGLPLSLIEAMSCGLTPICTAVGGIPDVITDNENGYMSRDLSLNSYVDAINRFLKRPIDKNTVISNFIDNYSIVSCAEKYMSIYNS